MITTINSGVDVAMAVQSTTEQIDDVKSAAKAFESLFVNELLKSMRKANETMMASSEIPMMSKDAKFFYSLFDSQLAEHLSDNGGLGIAQALIRQLDDS